MKYKSCKEAFSLIEILIVVAILSMTTIFATTVSISSVSKSTLVNVVDDIRSRMFRCQQNAYSGKDNSACGVYFENNKITVFSGDSFVNSVDKDELVLEKGVSVISVNLSDGGNQVVFAKGKFKSAQFGDIVFSDGYSSYKLSINKEGLIDFVKND